MSRGRSTWQFIYQATLSSLKRLQGDLIRSETREFVREGGLERQSVGKEHLMNRPIVAGKICDKAIHKR